MKHRILKQVALAGGLLVLVGCSDAGHPGVIAPVEGGIIVNVTLTEFGVEMDQTDIPVGVPVTFVVTNEGAIEHNLVLEVEGAIDEPLVSAEDSSARVDNLAKGQTGHFTYTFDDEGTAELASSFQLGCHIPGHFEAGMVQTFTVG